MNKKYSVGIDIGSTSAKTIILDENETIVYKDLKPTGYSSVSAAGSIYQSVKAFTGGSDLKIVATGYGRISVPYADKCITEITCHAKGAVKLFDRKDLVVIDIGGQDTKLIVVENGAVAEFVMNDKCSAGTGRFLEVMANTLSVTPEELCEMAESGREVRISSLCTVFAESEVTGLIGRGTPREDIAFAIIDSVVQKVKTQAGKLNILNRPLCLTGGLCDFLFVRKMLGKAFGTEVMTRPEARFAGALGAALYAGKE